MTRSKKTQLRRNNNSNNGNIKTPPYASILVVEPGKAPYLKTIAVTLENLCKEVGGILAETCPYEPNITVCYNADYMINGSEPNRVIKNDNGALFGILCGTFLVVQRDSTNRITSLSDDLAQKYTELLKDPVAYHSVPVANGLEMVMVLNPKK